MLWYPPLVDSGTSSGAPGGSLSGRGIQQSSEVSTSHGGQVVWRMLRRVEL